MAFAGERKKDRTGSFGGRIVDPVPVPSSLVTQAVRNAEAALAEQHAKALDQLEKAHARNTHGLHKSIGSMGNEIRRLRDRERLREYA
jgi:hypothetical protein